MAPIFRPFVRLALVAVVAAGTVAGGIPGSPARAAPARPGLPGGFSSWGQLFDVQQRLDEAAFRVESVSTASTGYAGVRVDVTSRSVTVYWKGRPPAEVAAVLTAIRAGGTPVKVLGAPYSKAELDARVDLITRDAATTGGSRLLTVARRPDGSGIDVEVAAGRPAAPGSDLPHLQQAVHAGGVSVTETTRTVAYTRESDGRPYFGGALMKRRPDNKLCTTGFATRKPSTGETFLMTAAHCGEWGTEFTTGAGSLIGKITARAPQRDAAFIKAESSGRVYDGPPVYQNGQFSKPVRGAAHSVVGDFVCLSGALTGAVCWVQVVNTAVTDCSRPELGCVRTIGATSVLNPAQFIAGQGDSGGPVFALTDNDTAEIARGIIHSSWGPVKHDCFEPVSGRTRDCSTAVLFADVLVGMEPFEGMEVIPG
jgi:hypothetical protein